MARGSELVGDIVVARDVEGDNVFIFLVKVKAKYQPPAGEDCQSSEKGLTAFAAVTRHAYGLCAAAFCRAMIIFMMFAVPSPICSPITSR